jgi:hypothetical protein
VRVQKKRDIECECVVCVFLLFIPPIVRLLTETRGGGWESKKAEAGCLVISSSSGCGSTKTQRPSPQTVFSRVLLEISVKKAKKLEDSGLHGRRKK